MNQNVSIYLFVWSPAQRSAVSIKPTHLCLVPQIIRACDLMNQRRCAAAASDGVGGVILDD
ncbi:hypothetical protein NQZ68_027981 [Dissostichus eleginoides]|nr:hypothetical protein NQZ68_027981 [Dissostichus eleginoides]